MESNANINHGNHKLIRQSHINTTSRGKQYQDPPALGLATTIIVIFVKSSSFSCPADSASFVAVVVLLSSGVNKLGQRCRHSPF
jgi:hypothetical protein